MNALFALALLQETTTDTAAPVQTMSPAVGMILGLCYLVVILLIIISLRKIFVKAGKPGWAAIVPIYNMIVILEIAGKPLWWFILLLIPGVNIIVLILVYIAFARNFGKGVGFAIGMVILPFIFFPLLAFGDARYQPVAA
jgi:hypothetical protein